MDAQDGQDFLIRESRNPESALMADICERRRRIYDFHGNDGMKSDNVN